MGQELKLPTPPFPDRLPFEAKVQGGLHRVAQKVNQSRPARSLQRFVDQLPHIAPASIGTPFGTVRSPKLDLPEPKLPELDNRRMQALKASAAQDLCYLFEWIPVIGEGLGRVVEDTYWAKIHETLTPGEFERFKEWDKKSPLATISMAQALLNPRKGGD